MKNLLIFIITATLAVSAISQEEKLQIPTQVEQKSDVEKGIMKLNFLPMSLSYEFRVDQSMTMTVEPSFSFTWTNGVPYFSPHVNVYFRHYYNFTKRNMKGKRTAKNSANFVGATMVFNFWNAAWTPSMESNDYIRYFSVGPLWGIQRNYSKHFSLGINLSPLISLGNKGIKPDAMAMVTLGFWLGN